MGAKGYKHTPEARARMAEAMRGNKHWQGRTHSEETRAKISAKLMGHPVSDETRRKMSEARVKAIEAGKKPGHHVSHSEEARQKISEAKKGCGAWNKGKTDIYSDEALRRMSESQLREKGNNWQGGLSYQPYSQEFTKKLRRDVRKRDEYVCKMCGHKWVSGERSLSIHHIDYDKNNNALKNLVSLCAKCHGKTNYNRESWKSYFEELELELIRKGECQPAQRERG